MPRYILFLTVLPFIAACASTDPVRAPNVALPGQYEAQVSESDIAPIERWWTAFEDPQLEALIEEALANAPEAELALARLEEARATRLANIRGAYPTGALIGGITQRGTDQISGGQSVFQNDAVTTTANLGFDVSWEADLWGKTRAGLRGVEHDFAAKVFNIEGARASLAANVADSLFVARGVLLQLIDAQENARIADDLLELTQLLAERGLVADADMRRARAESARAGAAVVQLEGELVSARRALLILLGRGTDPLDTLPILLPDVLPPPPPQTVPGELLQRRPDVREAEERIGVAIAQLKADRRSLFPRFTINPGIGLTQTETESFTGFDESTGAPTFGPVSQTIADWSIGLNVSVPVLDRPRLLAVARASDARAEQAVIAYETAVQRAYGEADTALAQLESDRERLALLRAAETDAQSAYDLARLRYEAGVDDLTSLLSAEQAWRSARSQAIAALVQYHRRSVQAFKALGGGWTAGDDFEV